MVIELRTHVYRRNAKPIIIKYPATWWDTFKQFWFAGIWSYKVKQIVMVPREEYPAWEKRGEHVVTYAMQTKVQVKW